MRATSIEPIFSGVDSAVSHATLSDDDIAARLSRAHFNEAFDLLRAAAASAVEADEATDAIMALGAIEQELSDSGSRESDTLRAAVMQVLTALYIETGDLTSALSTAAGTLSILASSPRRKDEPFTAILAALLYDLAYIHSERKEYKQAERTIEKALRLLDRLARTAPARYGAAHILALNMATAVCRNREQQAAMLEEHQAATTAYLHMVNAGVGDATSRLVDSLASEGDTLTRMGRYREAVQYYVKALKFLTRIDESMTLRRLTLSIELGDAMLHLEPMRDKAIHLLNTLLHQASRLNCESEHRRIVDILASSRSRDRDILSFWHKIFPK